jgi:hypothetical protein
MRLGVRSRMNRMSARWGPQKKDMRTGRMGNSCTCRIHHTSIVQSDKCLCGGYSWHAGQQLILVDRLVCNVRLGLAKNPLWKSHCDEVLSVKEKAIDLSH